ncbi:MAG: type IV pilin protein [Gemmatimonadota bacterium]
MVLRRCPRGGRVWNNRHRQTLDRRVSDGVGTRATGPPCGGRGPRTCKPPSIMFPPTDSLRRLRGGYTLIELLVVVVFIAILATIALNRFRNVSQKSIDTTIKSDIRNAMAAEVGYYADAGSISLFRWCRVERRPSSISMPRLASPLRRLWQVRGSRS